MAKIGKSNKKHYSTPGEKAAQRARTKANKIRKLKRMLLLNPNNTHAQGRLTYWETQVSK